MRLFIEIFHGRQIQVASDHFSAIWELSEKILIFEVINNEVESSMTLEQYEDFSAEVDNLNRAIFLVNTEIRDIVFDSYKLVQSKD